MSLESQDTGVESGDTGADLDAQLMEGADEGEGGENTGDDAGTDSDGDSSGDNPDGDDSGDTQSLEDLLDETSMSKKVKLKVNGEEKVMTVAEAIKVKQLEEASHQRMREAAEDKKMAKRLFNLAKEDPAHFLKLTGQDPFKFAQATVAERLEMMGLTDEQREAIQLKQENASLKQRQQAWEQQQRQAEIDAETEKEFKRLSMEVDEAWKGSGLPEQSNFKSSIAQVMIADRQQKYAEAQEQGLDPSQLNEESFLTAKQAAEIVKSNWSESVKQTFSNMDAEAILGMFDKKTLTEIKKALVKRASDKTSPKYKTGPGKSPASNQSSKNSPLSEREYREWQEKLMNGLA